MAKKSGVRRGRRRAVSPFRRWAAPSLDAYVLSWEDSCLPVPLRFGAPLVENGSPGPFEYHWQLLTFEFALPDPADFPPMTGFTDAERRELLRFVTTCEDLSGCAALRHHGGMAVNAATGDVSYEPVPADRSGFDDFAVRVRRLHGDFFDSVSGVLARRALEAEDPRAAERIGVLAQWAQARTALRERPLRNLVARSMLRRQRRAESEANYEGVRPDDVLAASAFDGQHAFMVSALGLCHLYFGYALLVRAAVGSD